MNTVMQRVLRGATLAVALTAAAPMTLAAGAALAEDAYRVPVGDLSQADQAAVFNHRLEQTADRLCSYDGADLSSRRALEACRKAVRDEAMAQLTRTQREQYAALANGMGATRTGQ